MTATVRPAGLLLLALLSSLGACGRADRAEAAALRAELEAERARRAEAEARVVSLREELGKVQELRVAREMEWLDYNQALATLDLPVELVFRAQGIEPPPREEEVDAPPTREELAAEAAEEARREASEAVRRSLNALLRTEEVWGLDVLEAGDLHDGFTGPVVIRLLDEHGRLAGSLAAERLRLEGSISGRTLTIVLEDGYESHRGERTPFDDGVRRIVLALTNPAPWIETLPELFSDEQLGGVLDDGRWDLARVQSELNDVLALAPGGSWRLRHLAGVVEDELQQVHLSELDAQGRLVRHVFADRMHIERLEGGCQLVLEDGVSMRGDEKSAFRDGRYRIVLPGIPGSAWDHAHLPGLVDHPSAADEVAPAQQG